MQVRRPDVFDRRLRHRRTRVRRTVVDERNGEERFAQMQRCGRADELLFLLLLSDLARPDLPDLHLILEANFLPILGGLRGNQLQNASLLNRLHHERGSSLGFIGGRLGEPQQAQLQQAIDARLSPAQDRLGGI